MNIARFKTPVIVAAGLHGALFFFAPVSPMAGTSNTGQPLPPPDPPRQIEVEIQDPEDTGTTARGAGEALPSLPETPTPPDLKAPFEMPEVTRAAPEKTVPTLQTPGIGGGGNFIGPGRIGAPPIASIGNLDRPPRAMSQPAPTYPYAMRTAGITGSVVVEFVVNTAGEVISAEAVKWTHRDFVDPAVRAVMHWRFEPGTVQGKKVRFRMAVPIEFNATG